MEEWKLRLASAKVEVEVEADLGNIITERGCGGAIILHENDSEGLKDVNVITKFKQEIHEKGDESGAIVLLNTK